MPNSHRQPSQTQEREKHTSQQGTMSNFLFPQAEPQAPPVVANHWAFAPTTQTHIQEVEDALRVLATTYPTIHPGKQIETDTYEDPRNVTESLDKVLKSFTAHVVVDGSNVALPALKSSTLFEEMNLRLSLLTRIGELVQGIYETAQHMTVIMNFYVVTQDPRVSEWWGKFIRDQLLGSLNLQNKILYARFTLVVAPRGPSRQPGLYEDQLIVDISNTIVGVLDVSDDWAGRVVLMTADGNDRTGDVRYVAGVNGPAEDFPTHIERVNREFIMRRNATGQDWYHPVWHVSPATLDRTSHRHKWGNALTFGVGGREDVSAPMQGWLMDWD